MNQLEPRPRQRDSLADANPPDEAPDSSSMSDMGDIAPTDITLFLQSVHDANIEATQIQLSCHAFFLLSPVASDPLDTILEHEAILRTALAVTPP